MKKIINQFMRFKNIVLNVFDMFVISMLLCFLFVGFMSFVLAIILTADVPVTSENVQIVLNSLPKTIIIPFALGVGWLLFNVIPKREWKLSPLSNQTNEPKEN